MAPRKKKAAAPAEAKPKTGRYTVKVDNFVGGGEGNTVTLPDGPQTDALIEAGIVEKM